MIPIKPMASPLKAPSTAPIWMATEVPTPCEEAPNANPLAIRLSMPKIFITNGPTMLPKIPTATTMTAVREGMPPDFSAMPIAIGVVTDFGSSVATNAASAPISSPIAITLTNPDNCSDKDGRQDRNHISFQVLDLLYSTYPNATTDGPNRKWMR